MGAASFQSFTDNPFFRDIDFEALERKELEPVFVPSSEKTNFDATYDLEELLLEEAPLEARARRQKPRDPLKEDATEKEVRQDELYRMIETQFLPFDYTTAAYDRFVSLQPITIMHDTNLNTKGITMLRIQMDRAMLWIGANHRPSSQVTPRPDPQRQPGL
jgi:hypothetical protein